MRKKLVSIFLFLTMFFTLTNVKADTWNLNQTKKGNKDVMYSWWNNPLAVSYGHSIYFGFTNSNGYKGVGKYDKVSKETTQTYIAKTNEIDDHNTASVIVLNDGRIAAVYSSGHNLDNKIHIRISSNPDNISSFDNEITLTSAGKTTYSQVLTYDGTYYLFYRCNTKSWMMRKSKDFVKWSDEVKIVYNNFNYREYENISDQYYVNFKKTKTPHLFRMVMQANPTYADTNIRMGFIDVISGNIYNSDTTTVLGNINDVNMKGIPSNKFNILIPSTDSITNRLFDVAVTDPNNTVIAYAQHEGPITTNNGKVSRTITTSNADYYIYRNGESKKVVENSYKFWKKYYGGISFIDSQNFVAAYGQYNGSEGTDYLNKFTYNQASNSYNITANIDENKFYYNGNTATRIIRPIVDSNSEFILWLKGKYDIENYKNSNTDIYVKSLDNSMVWNSTTNNDTSTATASEKSTKISFENKTYEVVKGKTKKLKLIVSPKGSITGTIKYFVSDKSIATIDNNGKVKGVKNGTVTITAKDANGNKTTCKVEVKNAKDIDSTSIKLSGDGSTILVGKSKTVEVTSSPNKSNPGNLTYTSSSTKVATVNNKGKITAKNMGTTTITVKNNKGLKDSISIKVVELKFKKNKVTLKKVGDKEQLELDHGVKGKVTYSSADTSIATVSSTGVVTGKAIGVTNVVAYIDSDDSVKTSIKIEVGKKITDISSKEKSIGLKVGDTKQLNINVTPKDASNPTLTYKSLDSGIAKVNSKGVITGVKEGSTTIVVNTRDGSRKTVSIAVTVSPEGNKKSDTKSIDKDINIKLNKKVVTLQVGKSETVKIEKNPKKISSSKLEWYSVKPSVAKVNSKGKITGVSSGKTFVYLLYNGGNKNSADKKVVAMVRVDVDIVKVSSIKLKETTKTIKVGETSKVEIKSISPSNATNQKVKWSSSKPSIVSVDQNGNIKGLKTGKAIIYAFAKDDNKTNASCTVTVNTTGSTNNDTSNTIKATSIKINQSNVSLGKNQTTKLTVSFAPGNVTSKKLKWVSSNSSVVSVSQDGTVKGLKKGTVTITAQTTDGSKRAATCKVSVVNKILITSISIDSKISLKAGKTKTLNVLYKPTNASKKSVKWTSSNKNVAIVSTKGVVKAKSAGTAVITATAADGSNKTATCTVTVTGKTKSTGKVNEKEYSQTHTGDEIIQKRIFIGDSRTKGMHSAVGSKSSDVWSAQESAGYDWMVKTGVPDVENKIGKATAVIFLIGVNDYGNNAMAESYSKYINDKAAVWVKKGAKVYFVSVNAVDDSKSKIAKNHSINAFNVKVKSLLSKNVTYIDTYNNINWNKVKFDKEGVHYDAATYKSIYNLVLNKVYNVKKTTKSKTGKTNNKNNKSNKKNKNQKTIKVTKVNISGKNGVQVGKTITLKAVIKPSTATNQKVTWKSSDKSIATVSSKGVVKGIKKGTVTITATAKDGSKKKGTYKVTVSKASTTKNNNQKTPTGKTVKVTKVVIGGNKSVEVGKTITLKVTVTPNNATNKNVTWKTSDKTIATVTDKGVVKGIKKGTVTITATAKDGSKKKDTYKVTVNKKQASKPKNNSNTIPVTKVKISGTSNIKVGKTTTLKVTVTPTNATNKNVTWSSSDKSIATVTDKGVVKGIKKGTVTITATAKDGSKKKDTYKVVISNKASSNNSNNNSVKVTKVVISGNKKVVVGKTITLKATISPSNATNKNVTWTSSNKSIATVSDKGVVKGIKKGTVTITATAKDGSKKKDTFKVTVDNKVTTTNQSLFKKKVTKITVSGSKTVAINKTTKLKANIAPSNAYNKNVTWSSSDRSIATVSASGVVKGIKQGKVVITATAKDGSKVKGKYNMTVTKYEEMKGGTNLVGTDIRVLSFAEETITSSVGVGEYIHFEVFSYDQPNNKYQRISNGKLYTVTSSNENVLSTKSVWKDKKHLTAKSVGTATITITLNSNNKSTSFTVNVVNTPTFSIKNNNRKLNDKNCYTTPLQFDIVDNSNKSIYNVQYETDKTYPTAPSLKKRNLTINNNVAHITVYNPHKYIKFEAVNKAGVIYFFGDNREYLTNIQSKCDVTPKKKKTTKKVTSISITGDKSVAVGKSIQLATEVLPTDATNKEVTWSSNNKAVAIVSSKGVVKGIKKGTVTITAIAKDGSKKSATYKITVTKKNSKKSDPAISGGGTNRSSSNDSIHFINVGSSDATLIESNGEYGLIDASNPGSSSSINPSFNDSTNNGMKVVSYLNKKGVKHLKFVIASHDHSDHIGGIPELVYNSGLVDNTTTYIYKTSYVDSGGGEVTQGSWQAWNNREYSNAAINAMQSKGAQLLETSSHTGGETLGATFGTDGGQYKDYISFKMGDYSIKIYNLYNNTFTSNVASSYPYTTTDENSNSLITVITNSNGKKALLMGDINVRDRFEQYYAEVVGKVNLLKASHHGYNYSNSKYLFDKTKPSIVVIPNNKDLLNTVNMGEGGIGDFGAARIYLKDMGCKVYETGYAGDGVTVSFSDSASVSGVSEISSKVNDGFYIWYDNNDVKKYYYIKSNKFIKNAYVTDGSKNASGNKNWYWMDKEGVWNGSTYSFVQNGSNWNFKAIEGSSYQAVNEWVILDHTYYFDGAGIMVTGWQQIKGKWYYFNSDGAMQTGWVKSDGKYYYLSPKDGSMQSGNQTIEGKKYQFNKDGSLKK